MDEPTKGALEVGFGGCGLCLHRPCTCNDPEPEQETCSMSPTCPVCRATIYPGDLSMDDGDECMVECSCGATYNVRLVVTHDYYSTMTRAAAQKAREEGQK